MYSYSINIMLNTVYVKAVEGETFMVRAKMKIRRENLCGRSFL